MKSVAKVTWGVTGCAGLLAVAKLAAAGDHLKCYSIKDPHPRAKFSNVTLLSSIGLPPESNCFVVVPAKKLCAPVTKSGVPPQPGGGGPTGNTTKFLCYKVRCPLGSDLSIPVKDQFGTRTVVARQARARELCVPASPSGAFLDD